MPSTVGTSVIGRQVLGTVTGNEQTVYVWITSAGITQPLYKGVVALEYFLSPQAWQLEARKFYPNGVVFERATPFQLSTQIVCYWVRAGLLWKAEWE